VLRGLGFRLGVTLLRDPPSPDLVLVAVERGHVSLRLAAARDRARGAPVVAVLRSSDAALASRALAAGAHAFHALDTSLERLRDMVLVLLGLAAARPRPVTSDHRRRRRATRSPAPAA
jgi:DNA-binding NarL/FixJ family response regulator